MRQELGRILDSLPGLVFTATPQGHVDFLNQEWSEFAGLDGTGSSDQNWEATINPDDFPGLSVRWKLTVACGERADMQARLRQFDGLYRPFTIRCKPVRDADGRIVKWHGLAIESSGGDANRAADVISRLRALFSQNSISTEAVDLNAAVIEVIVLYRGDIQRIRTILRTDLAEKLPMAIGDRVQLQQIILNLLRNAIDAMSNVNDRPKLLQIKTEHAHVYQIRFSLCDVGVRFPDGNAQRIFDAFYSTKADGMGIDLSTSRSIIESHNGHLEAAPNDGPGVTVSFSVPKFLPSDESAANIVDADGNFDAGTSARTI